MKSEPPNQEVILKEYPKTSYWLDGKQIRAGGNLILTNERLIFLRQVETISDEQIQTMRQLSQANEISKLLQFALKLHQKNFELPLSSIASVKMGLLRYFPIQPYLIVNYITGSKKIKTMGFLFTQPFMKRLLMKDFPTLGWIQAINKAAKVKRKSQQKK